MANYDQLFQFRISSYHLQQLDELVNKSLYESRAEAVRCAIDFLLSAETPLRKLNSYTGKRIQIKNLYQKLPNKHTYRVIRPSQFANPYKLIKHGGTYTRAQSLRRFETTLRFNLLRNPHYLKRLRGKDLACFCSLDELCHADILLKYLDFYELEIERVQNRSLILQRQGVLNGL